ncbi:hypothetical protein SAMN05216439_0539 [Methanobrevibacter gottschalkii]|uniref:Sensory transduction regulator n=2 Tax=Methanobrevibacter gottschalkii TaxID=190974 RepID=A0A3N5C407_9EURY|nr:MULTISPECIES: DUF2299 family protein [Methanobrevibacter]MCQ2971220.1 DUF2299 domain-containing protein [archaeon]OEC93745.1 hypothetical protein A9505_02045 [Methanobrevibacter sp. A27]RPF52855.1 hypothetical protein EDC42_0414 [Methanobrevibacter gottschalkii DSM 11977]SEK19070.1 hypothetical protein SAMN05216439_0539 [Methanobrevibacter gottschalkii]
MINEKTIEKWLLDEDMLREMKFDENADFHFIIEFPKDNIIDIVKPKQKDCIVFACATQVSQEHINLMVSADLKTKKDFILELNFGLNNFLVDYELQIHDEMLQQFIITDQIFEDGLTKDNFIKTIKRVFKSKLHCIWLIEKKFNNPSFSPIK